MPARRRWRHGITGDGRKKAFAKLAGSGFGWCDPVLASSITLLEVVETETFSAEEVDIFAKARV